MSATTVLQAWSCTVRLVVDDPAALKPATADLRALLDRVDTAASRFRPDSELSRANGYAGRPVPVSRLLVELVDAALAAAADTGGAVDPTLGADLAALGYDRDLRLIASRGPAVAPRASSRRWQDVRLDREVGLLTVPRGSVLDLGATAKAWTADRAARRLSRRYGTAVLVELGGDLAVAGHRPDGWCVTVAERAGETGQLVLLRGGGLATSTTTVRRWQRDGHDLHHLLDPRTGAPTAGPWRTVSVAADSALAANTASTAAIVLGADAETWLSERGLAARLIAQDGAVTTAGRWPAPAMPVPA